MTDALEQLERNLGRVKHLGEIYSAVKAQTTNIVDASDILRAELVLSVSSFDNFVHEVVRTGMLQTFDGDRPVTSKYSNFEIRIEDVESLQQSHGREWFEGEIRRRHGWKSFQSPSKVSSAIKFIYEDDLWYNVAQEMGLSKSAVKADLEVLVDRRNKIAHEADINPNPASSRDRWPINAAVVTEKTDFVMEIAESIASTVEVTE